MLLATAVMLVKGQKAYLSKRLTSATYKNHWQNPGGKVEPGESPIQAIVRETQEETGLSLEKSRFELVSRDIFQDETGQPYKVITYVARLKYREKPRKMEEKHTNWRPVSLTEIPTLSKVVPALIKTLPQVAKTLA